LKHTFGRCFKTDLDQYKIKEKGTWAVVTGGSDGIGFQIAK